MEKITKTTYIFLYSNNLYATYNRGKHLFSINTLKKNANNYSTDSINSYIPNLQYFSDEWCDLSRKSYCFATTDEDIAFMIQLEPESILNNKAKKTFKHEKSLVITPESHEILIQLTKTNVKILHEIKKISDLIAKKQEKLLSICNISYYSLSIKHHELYTLRFTDYKTLSKFKNNINSDFDINTYQNIGITSNLLDNIDIQNEKTFNLMNKMIDKLFEYKSKLEENLKRDKEKMINDLSKLGTYFN